MTTPNIDTKKLREVFPRLTGTRQRDGVLILMPVEFLTDEDIEAIAATMLKLAEENEAARAIMQKFVTKCETGRARSVETYAEMTTWLAARKGDTGE